MRNRREFIKKISALAAGSLLSKWTVASTSSDGFGEVLPKRRLIRDGQKVTAFCLGGYHYGLSDDPRYPEKMAERAMELGIRFFDNARTYNGGRSEEYMGRYLIPKYRDRIFL